MTHASPQLTPSQAPHASCYLMTPMTHAPHASCHLMPPMAHTSNPPTPHARAAASCCPPVYLFQRRGGAGRAPGGDRRTRAGDLGDRLHPAQEAGGVSAKHAHNARRPGRGHGRLPAGPHAQQGWRWQGLRLAAAGPEAGCSRA